MESGNRADQAARTLSDRALREEMEKGSAAFAPEGWRALMAEAARRLPASTEHLDKLGTLTKQDEATIARGVVRGLAIWSAICGLIAFVIFIFANLIG